MDNSEYGEYIISKIKETATEKEADGEYRKTYYINANSTNPWDGWEPKYITDNKTVTTDNTIPNWFDKSILDSEKNKTDMWNWTTKDLQDAIDTINKYQSVSSKDIDFGEDEDEAPTVLISFFLYKNLIKLFNIINADFNEYVGEKDLSIYDTLLKNERDYNFKEEEIHTFYQWYTVLIDLDYDLNNQDYNCYDEITTLIMEQKNKD